MRVWVAELDGRVAGFTSFGPCLDPGLTSANELIDLWVDPERRGLGLGSRLVELVLSELPRPVVVWVLRGNERAAALYRRFGAQHTAVQRTETISEFGGFDIVDQLLVVHS